MSNPSPLLGLAVGDALGMPFETEGPFSPRIASWDGGYGHSTFHRLGPGQWTDDTQMSLALAEALLERGFYDPALAARNYAAWYVSGDCRGIGGSTRQAMEKLTHGADWQTSGIVGAEGNGSAMRAGPIGLFHRIGVSRLASAARDARLDAVITHRSDDATEGSVAVAVGVAHLAAGGEKGDLLEAAISQMEKSRVRTGLEDLERDIRRGDNFEDIVRQRNWILGGVSAHVVQTVPAAFALTLFGETYVSSVRNAVRLGGDTDTTAAITGALAGSVYGEEGIPKNLLFILEGRDRIVDLESRLRNRAF